MLKIPYRSGNVSIILQEIVDCFYLLEWKKQVSKLQTASEWYPDPLRSSRHHITPKTTSISYLPRSYITGQFLSPLFDDGDVINIVSIETQKRNGYRISQELNCNRYNIVSQDGFRWERDHVKRRMSDHSIKGDEPNPLVTCGCFTVQKQVW